MKRILCILLVLLLLAGPAGCMAVPQTTQPPIDIPIVTGAPDARTPSGTDAGSHTEAPGTEAPPQIDTEAPAVPDTQAPGLTVAEDGVYDSKEEVALYIHLYGHLPSNYITKKEAENLGWVKGALEPYAPGKCIGGSYFGNYEGLLPKAKGRKWTECDIDTMGKNTRGVKRIVFSNDGLIYYTEDHYESFELLYGEEG